MPQKKVDEDCGATTQCRAATRCGRTGRPCSSASEPQKVACSSRGRSCEKRLGLIRLSPASSLSILCGSSRSADGVLHCAGRPPISSEVRRIRFRKRKAQPTAGAADLKQGLPHRQTRFFNPPLGFASKANLFFGSEFWATVAIPWKREDQPGRLCKTEQSDVFLLEHSESPFKGVHPDSPHRIPARPPGRKLVTARHSRGQSADHLHPPPSTRHARLRTKPSW